MKKQLSEFITSVGRVWRNLGRGQKVTVVLILSAALAGVVFLSSMGSTSFMTALFTSRITDSSLLTQISLRLDEEGVAHKISDGMIYLSDKDDAKRMIALLVREDLVPKNASPWDVFKMDRWTTTDFERNVNLRRAISASLEQHIQALDDVDRARITLVMPDKTLFAEDQKEVSASIIITAHPGSDIASNPRKIQGIIKLVKFAVEGLDDKNITISDTMGNVLTDIDAAAVPTPPVKDLPYTPEVTAKKDFFDFLPISRNLFYAALVSLAAVVLLVICIVVFRKRKKDALLDAVRDMAAKNPEEVARLVKSWLSEDSR